MNIYNLERPDMGPITPIEDREAVYQLFLELKRGLVEDEQLFDCLRLWAKQSFSFGRDNRGTITMIEPQMIEIEPGYSIPW